MANYEVWNRTVARRTEDDRVACGFCILYGSIYHREFLAALYQSLNVSQLFCWDLEGISLPPNIFDRYGALVISTLKNGSDSSHLGYLGNRMVVSIPF